MSRIEYEESMKSYTFLVSSKRKACQYLKCQEVYQYKNVTEVYQYLKCQEVYHSSKSVLSYKDLIQYLKEVYKYFTIYKYVNILPYVKEVYLLIFCKLKVSQYFNICERSIYKLQVYQYSKQVYRYSKSVYQVHQYFKEVYQLSILKTSI